MRYIEGEEKLTAIFGRWPSFHDAEVWALTQERTQAGFAVVAVIHTFEMTTEVDARGHYKVAKHTRVTLRFVDCEDVQFEGFQHQNVLFSLRLSEDERKDAECDCLDFVDRESSCSSSCPELPACLYP